MDWQEKRNGPWNTLDTQHQLIIEKVQIIDLPGIGNQRVKHLADFHEVAPIFVGTRQAREFTAEDDAHATHGDIR